MLTKYGIRMILGVLLCMVFVVALSGCITTPAKPYTLEPIHEQGVWIGIGTVYRENKRLVLPEYNMTNWVIVIDKDGEQIAHQVNSNGVIEQR